MTIAATMGVASDSDVPLPSEASKGTGFLIKITAMLTDPNFGIKLVVVQPQGYNVRTFVNDRKQP